MSSAHKSRADPDQPAIYEIKVKGHLDDRWANWFGDLVITPQENGNTILTGTVVDQAALHGLLKKIRDLGLALLSVNQIKPDQTGTQS